MAHLQTLSEENYLKSIYILGRSDKEKVSPTAIAEALQNNPASVVDMLKKLVDKELVEYEKSKGVRLTATGEQVAILVVRKHRLWEVFLHDKLEYNWEEIHEIAEQLEHIHHPTLADRLERFLNFPEYDPHGDPIPKANGEVPVISTHLLLELSPGKTSQVTGVKDTSTAFLQYLNQLRVGIGTSIKVLEQIPYDDSLVIEIESEKVATVSKKFAENVVMRG